MICNWNSDIIKSMDSNPIRYDLFAPKLFHLCREHGFISRKYSLGSQFNINDPITGSASLLLTKNFAMYPWELGHDDGSFSSSTIQRMVSEDGSIICIQNQYLPCSIISGSLNNFHVELDHPINRILSRTIELYNQLSQLIIFKVEDNVRQLVIPNTLLSAEGWEGIQLHLNKLVKHNTKDKPVIIHQNNEKTVFIAHSTLVARINKDTRESVLGRALRPQHFSFINATDDLNEAELLYWKNLANNLPGLIYSKTPYLDAHLYNLQVTIDKNTKLLLSNDALQNRAFFYISGFSLSHQTQDSNQLAEGYYMPWQAMIKKQNGDQYFLNKEHLNKQLMQLPVENKDQIDLEEIIRDSIDDDHDDI